MCLYILWHWYCVSMHRNFDLCVSIKYLSNLYGQVVNQGNYSKDDQQNVGEDESSHGIGQFLDLSASLWGI